jgi:nitrogen regulatory protein PII
VVDDESATQVEGAIIEAARTGKIGDGKVFTYDCESAARIRTGERGLEAL